MKAHVGGAWHIRHLTDRVVELVKDDLAYRRLTGRDGFVRVRAEPGMDRQQMLDKAIRIATENDVAISFRVAHDLIPSARATRTYREQVKKLAPTFATPEEPELIGVKRA